MTDWTVRVRRFLGDNAVLVLGALAVVALLGGALTYTSYVDPGTETETVEDASWSSTGAYDHRARVSRNTSAFTTGTVLQDRDSYFLSVSPELNGTFRYRYEATESGQLRVETTNVLVLRSASEDETGDVVEYWRVEEPLTAANVSSLSPGEAVDVGFQVNVTNASSRATSIEAELGGTPGQTELLVQSRVELSGTRNGQTVDRTRTYDMQVRTQAGVYSVQNDEPQTNSGSQVREVTVEASYGPLRTVGAPVLLLAALLSGLGVAVGCWQDAFTLSEAERVQLDYASSYEEYEDWISAGRLPDSVLDGPQVSVDSLEELVDVAIDSDRRVLEDSERGVCAVLVDDIAYVYQTPAVVDTHRETAPLTAPADTDSADDDSSS